LRNREGLVKFFLHVWHKSFFRITQKSSCVSTRFRLHFPRHE
jgi:hypothetical protein